MKRTTFPIYQYDYIKILCKFFMKKKSLHFAPSMRDVSIISEYWSWRWSNGALSIVLNIDKFKRKLYVKFNLVVCWICEIRGQKAWLRKSRRRSRKKSGLRNRAPVCCSVPSINKSLHYWNACEQNEIRLK